MPVSDEDVNAAIMAYYDVFQTSFFGTNSEHSRAMKAALESFAARIVPEGWRPIESAPKDGTSFLAFAADPISKDPNYFGVAQWAERQNWHPRSVEGWFWSFSIRPTHWMPLPSSPSGIDSGK